MEGKSVREFGHKQGTGAWSLEFESFCFLCVTQAGPVVYAGAWQPTEHIPGNTVDIFYFSLLVLPILRCRVECESLL